MLLLIIHPPLNPNDSSLCSCSHRDKENVFPGTCIKTFAFMFRSYYYYTTTTLVHRTCGPLLSPPFVSFACRYIPRWWWWPNGSGNNGMDRSTDKTSERTNDWARELTHKKRLFPYDDYKLKLWIQINFVSSPMEINLRVRTDITTSKESLCSVFFRMSSSLLDCFWIDISKWDHCGILVASLHCSTGTLCYFYFNGIAKMESANY